MRDKNPDMVAGEKKKFVMRPPQVSFVLFSGIEMIWGEWRISESVNFVWKIFGRHCFDISTYLAWRPACNCPITLYNTTECFFYQVVRVGSKKTAFANFSEIAKMLHRQPKVFFTHLCKCELVLVCKNTIWPSNLNILQSQHLLAFLFAELGTSGAIDGSNQLIMKGGFVISLQCGQCL